MSHVRELQGNRSMLALKNKNIPPFLNRETNETLASLIIQVLAKKPCLSILWLQTGSYNFHSEEYVPKRKEGKVCILFLYMFSRKPVICFSDTSYCYATQCNTMKCDRSWKMKMSLWDNHCQGIHLSVCIMPFQVKSEQQKSRICGAFSFYKPNININSRSSGPKMKYKLCHGVINILGFSAQAGLLLGIWDS